ncbi:hypothetical protein, partial [Bilophila wadsworthia]|uniref:hypothetical protein n=1 Tax=Bilophila wadsworthia TaxID=35833 RepID=UPI002674FEF4
MKNTLQHPLFAENISTLKCILFQRQPAPEKLENRDSINTKVFEEEGVGFGEGEEKLSSESFSS